MKRLKLRAISGYTFIKNFKTPIKINMISNVKIPGLEVTSKEKFLADSNMEWGRVQNSWPSNGMYRGQLVRKLRRPHPTTGIMQSFVVFEESLDEFPDREAEIEVLPPRTEFTFTLDSV